jgi:uracil-DNA glycosylase family 4
VETRSLAQAQGAQCSTCPMSNDQGPVYGKPAVQIRDRSFGILVCAERPGDVEVVKKEPLAGRSGWILDRMLSEFGIARTQVSTTNAQLCTRREYVTEGIFSKCITACRGRLVHDVVQAKAHYDKLLVLLLGKHALAGVTRFPKNRGITKRRGFPVTPSYPGFPVQGVTYFPTFHPSAIPREPYYLPLWRGDFQNALNYSRGLLQPVKWPPIDIDITPQVLALLEGLATRRTPTKLGLDIETAGKEPMLAESICVGLATPDWAISFPIYRPSHATELLAAVLANPNLTFVLQNGNHDLVGLGRDGYPEPARTVDILNKARIRFPWIEHDLQSLVSYFYFIPKHKLEYRDDKGGDEWGLALRDQTALERLMVYNAKDAWTTVICDDPLDAMLDEEA